MSLTVAEVLELDIMKQALATVMAGQASIDRQVRWVHISEQPDIAGFLKGGELLLTTGMGLGHNAALHRRYVKELAAVPIAGLIIRLGGTFSTLPPSLIEEAEARGLPIIALRRRFGAIELTEQIHSAIISHQFELIAKAETIGRRFTDLVTRGAALEDVLKELASIVENPVVLEDPAHQLVAFSVHRASPDAVLEAWEEHSRKGHVGHDAGVQVMAGNPGCAWAPVWFREEPWGRLHVLEIDRALDDIDRLALDRAVASVALTLLGESEARRLADRACYALIADILEDRQGSPHEFFRRAVSCRADFRGKTLVAMVLAPVGLPAFAAEQGLEERDRERLREGFVTMMREAIRQNGAVGLCGLDGDRVLAIVGVVAEQDERDVTDRIGQEACRRLAEELAPIDVVVGASAGTPAQSLRRALEEAGEAAAYARGVGARQVCHFSDLGLQHLLLRLADGPELARFVESQLSGLLHYDAEARSPLLPTLRAFLAHGGQKKETAADLTIERRTLYHRLERLEKVLGGPLDDQETRFRLSLALRGLDLLRQQSPAPVMPLLQG